MPDAALRKEYDQIKSQIGDKEYKVRHILVEKEADANEIIASLQKGDKFEKLAERSKDPGSKDKGGDLDWNAPGNFVKPFSDAMVATPKGKFTTKPVQTQFGWHVILVEDVREAKIPSFEEVKPQLQQRMQAQMLDQYFKELRAKNGHVTRASPAGPAAIGDAPARIERGQAVTPAPLHCGGQRRGPRGAGLRCYSCRAVARPAADVAG